ncbi:MAG: hypothetical protein JW940_38395 [Polyangiaceae bacterium]|nr:hypothetical protein [Polyangiaceae bacterium]
MKSKLAVFGLLAGVALCAVGCGARVANVSDAQSAYVVRQGFLGTDMYHCTAANPQKPVCKKVVEK